MKKIFSLFAAVLFAGSMFAAEVTILPSDFEAATSADYSITKDGVTVEVTASTVNADQMRIFKGQKITISAEANITKIEFTCTANGEAKYGPGCFAAQDGYTFEADGPIGTWVGEATSVEFTAESNQVRATQIVVTVGGEPVVADIYTVAGAPEEIFGAYWNPEFADNDMKKVGGIYTWEKAGLELTPDDKIEFKVVKNHSWDIAFPASNFEISADEEGVYTLRISFDPATEEVDAVLEGAVVIADPTNCAEAREAALSVSANNELYNDGKEYTIEGYVTSIAYAWKEGSMSFWMADAADGGNVLEAYKCAIENAEDAVRVGDKVAVTGKLTKYNTTPEFAAGCTVVIIERAEPVDPLADPTNCAEAREAALSVSGDNVLYNDGKEYTIEGYVTAIKTVYSDQYHNISFWIADEKDGGEVLQAYRAACAAEADAPNVGDKVAVTGSLTKYGTTPEFAQGCTFEIIERASGEGIEETATDAKAVKVVRNGQVYILRGDKTFNLIGAEVK